MSNAHADDSFESAPRRVEGTTRTSHWQKRLRRRYAAEKRFQAYGIIAICLGISFLVVLFSSIIGNALPAFTEARIKLEVHLDQGDLGIKDPSDEGELLRAYYLKPVREALKKVIPPADRAERKDLYGLLSVNADAKVRQMVLSDPTVLGTTQTVWVLASGDVDVMMKGIIGRDVPEERRQINDRQLAWMDQLVEQGLLEQKFNTTLFTAAASAEPEAAGVGAALVGSLMMMGVVLILTLPIGVAAAVYLEEFAPVNWFTDLIEVNINNLAAVPSIVFGLLGLAVFINFMELPRAAPLIGGMVLTLMTLPTVIIATRAALKAVPPSIREAALGVGASKMQSIFHHVLPLAGPGILTSIIIGLAQALGETAPLLMIGMVAFVVDHPSTPLDAATALPVQIYMWSGLPERGFVARTSAAIVVLLGFLIIMNASAVWLRRKFERRW
ncbi:phosphate ABC transporter permease PstA [Roseospirillum parvum]|uniref:Phosphate transport system permease protein PstA n=1 Tax=Roseospirillum parvum TaxID=83401 RepID=A0A1G7X091_9PROT|nr:phosphate ABC transporter permease PstA [Roseospirillum parvum]SDG77595.1 phosphate transport system permease protein [Roseospirillum parvum]